MTVRCKLPILRNSTPVKPVSFAVGAAVLLRSAPSGEPGRVLGVRRGRVAVYWRDLDYTGMHAPGSLQLVTEAPRLAQAASAGAK